MTRFPRHAEVVSVLGICVTACHTWSIRGFLNELPSFLLYFRITEILVIFAYMMAFALLESLIVTYGLALLSVFLPSNWLKNGFAYKGFVVIVVGAVAAVYFQKNLPSIFPPMRELGMELSIPFLIIVFLMALTHKFPLLQKLLLSVEDRISVFLYIYVPLGLISFLVVVFRNLFQVHP